MKTHKVHTTLFVLIYLFGSGWTFEIELYSEKDRRGQSIKIDVSDNDCSELPLAWHSGVVSLDTLGNCVQLYDEPKCSGSLTVIQPFHIIHQMDLSLINYANRLRTVSPCGPKLKSGRYVIQNAADASVMSALNKHGNFAKVFTVNTTKSAAVPKSQQWEVLEKANSEYTLRPRENSDNYPVSFDEESLKKGVIKRKPWRIMSVGRGRYIIKDPSTQRCLYKTDDHNVEEHSCRIWSTNQEWVFRTIVGDPPADKPKAQIGQGYNFNIISKVATSRPPTKPPPQFYPIHFNATKLAQIKKFSTAAPYQINKKIKRGPRPKTKYFEEPALDLKPPGLRPALPKHVANNNNYLLYKPANGVVAQDSYLPEFVPSDDSDLLPTKEMIKSTKQYQEYVEIVKQYLAEQHKKSMEEARKKKKGSTEDEEETGAEEDDDETKEQLNDGDEEDDENNSDESVSEATAESQQQATDKPKKRKEKNTTSSKTADKPTNDAATSSSADQPGFMSQVFTKFKSNFAAMVPSIPSKLPSLVLPSLPSLPSVPVPKLTLSFTKPNDKKSDDKLKKITHGSGNSESGFHFSYANAKNGENQRTENPKFSFAHQPSRFFLRMTSTTTKKPLTIGSWGIFG